jgi:hypothetical protein
LFSSGPGWAEPPAQEAVHSGILVGAAREGAAIETLGPGAVNWTTGVVTATGIGAAPANAVHAAQARAMTERAAYAIALRNLLEALKGVRIDSTTVVDNLLVRNDAIRSQVTGIVKGARPIKTQYQPDGSVEVTVAIALNGHLTDLLLPKDFGRALSVTGPALPLLPQRPAGSASPLPPQSPMPQPAPVVAPSAPSVPAPPPSVVVAPSPLETAAAAETYTGLIVDARGLGLKPALVPLLLDEHGGELYAGAVLSRDVAVQAGVAGYSKDLVAGSRQSRVTDNPLIIKGLKASGAKSTNVVLGEEEVRLIGRTEPASHYLKQGRVVFVYD